MEQFCIIDASHFLGAYEIYASLEKQIASSSVFIINKIDTASADTIEATKNVIRKFHPDPLFFETNYADIPLESFFDLTPDSGKVTSGRSDEEKMAVMSSKELDKFIDDLLDSPDLEITPPDLLMSVAYKWTGDNTEQVKVMADALPASVMRAKGFVEENGNMLLFSFVQGDWTIEDPHIPAERVKHKNIIVFIGPPDSMDGIETATQTGSWINMGEYRPYSN